MLITWQFFQSYYSFVHWYGAHRCILMIQWTTQMSNCQCSLKFLKRGHYLDMQPRDFDIWNVTFCCTFLTYWVAGSLVSACIYHSSRPSQLDVVGDLPHLLALATSGASSEFRSVASYIPYASNVALGILGHCSAQASKVAHCNEIVLIQYFRGLCSCYHWCDCLIKRKVGRCFLKNMLCVK